MTTIAAQAHDLTGISGTPISRLLIQRLEYWFRGKKKKHFFKFLCPCDHKLYRAGDSWAEELGISRQTFKRHFDQIGTRWPSKSAFNAAQDPFLGKAYACYYDRKENLTRYFKNPIISLVASSGKDLAASAKKAEKSIIQSQVRDKLNQKQEFKKSIPNGHSGLTKLGGPLYTHRTPDKSYDLSSEEEKISKEVQEIWKREVGGFVHQSATFLKKLFEAFQKFFQGSLEAWKKYCRKIASSKFLMGEVTKFKAWLSWAIKAETVEKLRAGAYTLGDRVSLTTQVEMSQDRANRVTKILDQKSGKELEFHQNLRGRVGDGAYLAWFKETKIAISPAGGPSGENRPALIVQPTSSFAQSYIKQHFGNILAELAAEAYGQETSLEISKNP